MDGRLLVMQACRALNESKLLLNDVSVDGVLSASGKNLQKIVNKFLDDIETIPEANEHLIPEIVLSTYNGIVDESIIFSTIDNVPADLRNIIFNRTKFPK